MTKMYYEIIYYKGETRRAFNKKPPTSRGQGISYVQDTFRLSIQIVQIRSPKDVALMYAPATAGPLIVLTAAAPDPVNTVGEL